MRAPSIPFQTKFRVFHGEISDYKRWRTVKMSIPLKFSLFSIHACNYDLLKSVCIWNKSPIETKNRWLVLALKGKLQHCFTELESSLGMLELININFENNHWIELWSSPLTLENELNSRKSIRNFSLTLSWKMFGKIASFSVSNFVFPCAPLFYGNKLFFPFFKFCLFENQAKQNVRLHRLPLLALSFLWK